MTYWLEPPTRGQPPKRGQNLCSQSVLYSEVPLYTPYKYKNKTLHNFGIESRIKYQKITTISLKIIIKCSAYLKNDKMWHKVGLCMHGHMYVRTIKYAVTHFVQ